MFAGLVFIFALAELLLDFFCDQVDGRVKVGFEIFGVKIGSGQRQPNGAFKLAVGGFAGVVLENHAGIDGETVQMLQLMNAGKDMIFDGFGQRDIVRRKNKVHAAMMRAGADKIQRKSLSPVSVALEQRKSWRPDNPILPAPPT